MSFSVGIVGLPNVGKSTLFQALTKKKVDIAPRPFTTIDPNVGIVSVPDERLERISSVIRSEKTTPTAIKFVDIAGLVKGAHKGEGLGNQFLGHIRSCDAVLEVVRTFQKPEIENVLGEINPEKEIEVIRTELLMKDMETLDKIIANLENKRDKANIQKKQLCEKIRGFVSQGKSISQIELEEEEENIIKEYQFLTVKPIVYLFNGVPSESHSKGLVMDLKEEEEILELSERERKELGFNSHLDKIIAACYDVLGLITFFTVAGGKETRAWTLKEGSKAPAAGEVVHSDFKEKFIKADIVNWLDLTNERSWQKAKEKGIIKTIGKDYAIVDGDVVEFKI